jgi:hypothetical protein
MANLVLDESHAILLRFGYSFRLRRTEWIAAVQCFIAGFVLLLPYDTFSSEAYDVVRTWGSETMFGVLLLLVGMTCLTGLFVNGARKRVTPWMRLGGAILGAGIFSAISLGFAASGVIGLWLAAWPVAAVVEYFNIYDATRDARQAHG